METAMAGDLFGSRKSSIVNLIHLNILNHQGARSDASDVRAIFCGLAPWRLSLISK
jgi:hypothetical protein